ncbi:MAG: ankyrin repeat domain-containing protein, partial [Thermoanaerobaculia bacterium]|nr:ankyrin repeat domain-containing protein [Thermoanaerobaculia bacterium]
MRVSLRQVGGRGCVALVSLLVLAAAGDRSLVDAARDRDGAGVRELLAGGADVDVTGGDGATALHWAAYGDDVDVAAALLAAGAAADARNDLGVTPLALACENG